MVVPATIAAATTNSIARPGKGVSPRSAITRQISNIAQLTLSHAGRCSMYGSNVTAMQAASQWPCHGRRGVPTSAALIRESVQGKCAQATLAVARTDADVYDLVGQAQCITEARRIGLQHPAGKSGQAGFGVEFGR